MSVCLSVCLTLSVFIMSLLSDRCQGKITSQVVKSGYPTDMRLGTVAVLDVMTGPSHVTVNGKTAQFSYDADMKV